MVVTPASPAWLAVSRVQAFGGAGRVLEALVAGTICYK